MHWSIDSCPHFTILFVILFRANFWMETESTPSSQTDSSGISLQPICFLNLTSPFIDEHRGCFDFSQSYDPVSVQSLWALFSLNWMEYKRVPIFLTIWITTLTTFDIVPHHILVSVLEICRVEGWTTQSIKNWLEVCSQLSVALGPGRGKSRVASLRGPCLDQCFFFVFLSDFVSWVYSQKFWC